jgi:hypothetical protein
MLHIVRSDLPPAAHRLSEYANGPYGWLMTMSFIALGCGLMAMTVIFGVGRRRDIVARAIPAAAFLAGVATIASGIFKTGASGDSEVLHSRASAVAVVAVVALALMHSRPLNRHQGHDLIGASLALVALGLVLMSPLLHHTRWTGLSQRLLWIVLLTWLLRAAWRFPRTLAPSVLEIHDDLHGEVVEPLSRAEGANT